MPTTTLERALLAYAVGSLVGFLTLLAEVLFSTTRLTGGAVAFYSVVGGVVATTSRSLLGGAVSTPAARAGVLGALAVFGSLHLLYFANVKLLPGEHFLSWKSLAVDAMMAIPLLLGAFVLARARWAQRMRERWGRAGATAGAVLLAAGAGVLVSVWPRAGADPARGGEGPNLLLIVLDSVRRDRLPVEGSHPATPSLQNLARRGRTYTAAWAASSWTVPSVASMLDARSDAAEAPTLAERLAGRGYLTACFTDNPHLMEASALLRGFDRVERSVGAWRRILRDTALGDIVERLDPGSDRQLVEQALAWARVQPHPFFLYLHLMDSHTPYRFPPLDGRRRGGRRIEFPHAGLGITPEEADDIEARYDAGVHSADAEVGRVLAAASGWRRAFVAIITSDHGESLGEAGRWFHGHSLSPELLAIPLVVVGRGVQPGHVQTPVGHEAIPSTVLAATGTRCPDCVGPDLRTEKGSGVVEGGLPPRLAYRIAGRYKAILDLQSGQRQLFDLRADPEERRDLAAEKPLLAAAITARLTGEPPGPHPAPDSLERLRSLGYADAIAGWSP